MSKDSNFYTFLFSLLMVLVVASSLALTSESLKEKQNENVVKEKMQNIISTILRKVMPRLLYFSLEFDYRTDDLFID